MARIAIHRVNARWQDRFRDYRVMVDGREVARVGNDSSASVSVDPGTVDVQLQVDWCRSPTVRLDVGADETVHLECGPNANPLLALIYIVFMRDNYLWLHPVRRSSF